MFKAADDRQTPALAHLHSGDLLCIDVTHTVWHQRCALCEIIRFHTYWKDEELGVALVQTCMQLMCYIAVYVAGDRMKAFIPGTGNITKKKDIHNAS